MATYEHNLHRPLRLEPQYREYVWGGRSLRPDVPGPTAEVWIVYEHNRISDGPHQGKTLNDLATAYPQALLGKSAERYGGHFPLLIKILDCAEWLSVQVHPNDEQARRLEGADASGKTEAWHVLRAEPGASLLCGIHPGISADAVPPAVRGGKLLEHIQKLEMHNGDSILIRAGMVHALGPGLMVYEVQQTSDITYRVYDWDRPASDSRPLHIEKSLVVIDPALQTRIVPPPALAVGQRASVMKSEYFRVDLLLAGISPVEMNTRQQTFHAITALNGCVRVSGAEWEYSLDALQTLLIPAAVGEYQVKAESNTVRCLIAGTA